jgi:hypothetical protein
MADFQGIFKNTVAAFPCCAPVGLDGYGRITQAFGLGWLVAGLWPSAVWIRNRQFPNSLHDLPGL